MWLDDLLTVISVLTENTFSCHPSSETLPFSHNFTVNDGKAEYEALLTQAGTLRFWHGDLVVKHRRYEMPQGSLVNIAASGETVAVFRSPSIQTVVVITKFGASFLTCCFLLLQIPIAFADRTDDKQCFYFLGTLLNQTPFHKHCIGNLFV